MVDAGFLRRSEGKAQHTTESQQALRRRRLSAQIDMLEEKARNLH